MPSLVTYDLDEARVLFESTFHHDATLEWAETPGQMTIQVDAVQTRSLAIAESSFGAAVNVTLQEVNSYQVNVPLGGHLSTRRGEDAPVVAGDGLGIVYQPTDGRVRERWSSDCRLLGVEINRSALETQLARMLDAPVRRPIALGDLDTTGGAGRSWARLVRMLAADGGETGGLSRHPLVGDQLQDTVLSGLLLAIPHRYSAQLERLSLPTPGPRAVWRAVEFIHAHPDRPLNLAHVAAAAGSTERSLQAGFQRHLGVTPMTFLRQVRLDRAHADLRRAEPVGETVARVAHRWGFVHLGRFAAEYRKRHGERPSETLRVQRPIRLVLGSAAHENQVSRYRGGPRDVTR
jgi:AraC-like DNA-binding protein